ncbi:MAG: hypothetical protein RQ754_16095 [Desulfuromonadales bacterium]|nr:hypothetical protein [Desulfuromonadales bacterium]
MKIKAITSKWLESNGRRLDCGPYMSGGIEARMLIKKIGFEPLSDLTHGFSGGIFKAPRLSPNYVSDPSHGRPYLSSTDILCCDLSFVSLIANSQANGLEDYFVEKGMTLVTSSGDTGRTAFAREDMHGMMGSPHFMRIKPDENKIAPGYLFAFLSSKYGNRLMVSGTYGSIIQAIEPHHIADLPVPRLDSVELEAHRLVTAAADLRSRSNLLLEQAIDLLLDKSGLPELSGAIPSRFDVNVVPSSSVLARLDGLYHSRFHVEVVESIRRSTNGGVTVSEISDSVIEPNRFKRIPIEENEFAVPFFGTTPLMWATPKPNYFLSRTQRDMHQYIVSRKTILIPRSGQIAGLIGTAVLPYGDLIDGAVTEDAIRVNCHCDTDAGFLFVALRSDYGIRQLKARSYGSSIPHLDVKQIGQVLVPKMNITDFETIGEMGIEVAAMRNQAIQIENQAITLVERTIVEGGR